MIDETTVKRFYRRLNHQPYGVTELVALDRYTRNLVATGLFDDMVRFVSCCRVYNQGCNVYAGRNPRPTYIQEVRNIMDTVKKRRARDTDIQYLTAMSLDIDPIRPKDKPSTHKQHQAAIVFSLDLQWDLGGNVDDSGNGAYLWIPFVTPIEINPQNMVRVKEQCRLWHDLLRKRYKPEEYGLRIEGCHSFSGSDSVIGTFNHKAQSTSRFIGHSEPSDKVRYDMLSIRV